jgi:hypothetical protein
MKTHLSSRFENNLPMNRETRGPWTPLIGFRNGPVDTPGYGKTREERS